MRIFYRNSNLFKSCLVVLLIATSNNFIFEDLFFSLRKAVFNIDAPAHCLNHLGSTNSHKHSESSPTHEHGQPNPILIIKHDDGMSAFIKLLSVNFLIFTLFYNLTLKNILQVKQVFLESFSFKLVTDTNKSLRSLSLAAMAPPVAPPVF